MPDPCASPPSVALLLLPLAAVGELRQGRAAAARDSKFVYIHRRAKTAS